MTVVKKGQRLPACDPLIFFTSDCCNIVIRVLGDGSTKARAVADFIVFDAF